MRVLLASESEPGGKVLLEVLDLSDVGDKGAVELNLSVSLSLDLGLLLVAELGLGGLSYLCFGLEELGVLGVLLDLALGEEGVVDVGGVNSIKADLGGSGDHVGLVDSPEGDSVDLVGSSNQ